MHTSLAVATIDVSIGLTIEGESEPAKFSQRAVRIGARPDYEVVVEQKSKTPETLMLSREGLNWVASSDSRRSSLVRINGSTLTQPVTLSNGDQLKFLDWSATVALITPTLTMLKRLRLPQRYWSTVSRFRSDIR